MPGYRAGKTAHFFVLAAVVAAAGFLLTAAPSCRNDRPGRETAKKGRPAPTTTRTGGASENDPSWIVFHGTSDTSAGIALDERTLLVADDENNILRAYGVKGGKCIFRFDLTNFLGVAGKFPEVDIEGAARIGDRVYWISSHGRNRDGKWRPNRCRFFATDIRTAPGGISIRQTGRPYTKLAESLAADPAIRAACPEVAASFHQGKLGGDDKRRLAPKAHGLNIEGLCASADGNRLYIGLRNPLAGLRGASGDRAIVIPLLNPGEIVEKSPEPRFGRPVLWNLGGRGIRDMVRSGHHRTTFVLAGPHGGKDGRFALYRWSGKAGEQPVFLQKWDSRTPAWRPETIIAWPGSPGVLLLSDDGVVPVRVGGPAECIDAKYYRSDGTTLNKHLRDENRKYFRARWIVPKTDP